MYFSNQLRLIKPTLGIRDGEYTQHDLEVEDKLKSWMNNTPAYLQLQWFDAVEEVKISSELRSKPEALLSISRKMGEKVPPKIVLIEKFMAIHEKEKKNSLKRPD